MDAKYFLSAGYQAAEKLALAKAAGLATRQLGGESGIAEVWAPNRFKRVYASASEEAVPYLRPYDVFDYLPQAADLISTARTKNLGSYLVKKGTILQTCSGRNLGPGVLVDEFLSRFMMSHDLVRIEIKDTELRNYVLGFLASVTGQELLKRDKSGSVIDHISVEHVAAQEIPLLDDDLRSRVAKNIAGAAKLRETARLYLDSALAKYEAQLPQLERGAPMSLGWTARAATLTNRLDAANYDPRVLDIRQQLLAMGGQLVGDVASVIKPTGRYKTIYVDAEHGRPILSGAQVLQFHPVNLRFIASKVLSDPSRYQLEAGWTVYQADGRAEEGLGIPVMVTSDRSGWLASGHVGRIASNRKADAGWIYLAARTQLVQRQIKALASGSVVDSTFPFDMEGVVLPPPLDVDGRAITAAWNKFSKAAEQERTATSEIDRALAELSGVAA